jgi:hypothetical protein
MKLRLSVFNAMMLKKELEGMRKQLADAQQVRMNSGIPRFS